MTDQLATPYTRRRFVVTAGLAAAAAVLVRRRSLAEELGTVPRMRGEAATAKLEVQRVRDNLHVILGAGGNIIVATGADGKLLVDAGLSTARPALAAMLDGINSDPIKGLINTHWHFDHTDGNAWLHDAGATIYAQEKTRRYLSAFSQVVDWDYTFKPSPAGALPAVVFARELTLHLNGYTIALNRYEPAHTDSDLSVHFVEADVFCVADTWWNGFYPFIDYSTGGSIDGTIRATEANLANPKVSEGTVIVPGHGPVGNKVQLAEYRDMLVAIRNGVAGLKQQGQSLEDIVAAKPTAAYDAKWGNYLVSPEAFTHLVYKGV
ncbi:MAG: MBL fold metallo-hydrolase [Rhodospirillales bacterium]|nr:MBL fold metallo-hydrolase [Acetobacter sp.]